MRKADDADYNQMNAPLVPVTGVFLLGMLLGRGVGLHPAGVMVAGLTSAWAALWGRRRAKSRRISVLLLWLCLGVLRMMVWQMHPDTQLTACLSDEPQLVRLHGVVVDDPVELFEPGEAHAAQSGDDVIDPDRQVCVVELRHRETAHGWQSLTGRVRATVHSPRQLVRYGDEILVEGQWSLVPAPGNPGQYDWQAALARKRIHGLLRVRPFDGLVVLRSEQGNPMLAAIFRLRQRWVRLLQEHFEPRDAGLLLALLLGERTELDEHLREAFQTTGTIHLLVISGFNVGVMALLFELGLRLIGWPWRWRLIGVALGLGVYCLLTGSQPPVVRATFMAWMLLGAWALDRVVCWFNVLAAAALLMLWMDPMQLFDPGFQLSFGAVASLLLLTTPTVQWLQRALPGWRPPWLRHYCVLSLSATGAIWIGLSPVLAWYFHIFSPISLVANVLIAPLFSALVALGTGALMLSTIIEPVLEWVRGVLSWVLQVTIGVVSWCHQFPGGYWIVGTPDPLFLVSYYGLLSLSAMRHRLRLAPARLLLCWSGAIVLWVWSIVARHASDARWLRLDVLDVGHGDSIVIRAPSGRVLIVDAGTEEAGRFRLVPYLRAEGRSRIDALMLTHGDEDHVGGALPLLEQLRVERLFTNGARGRSPTARQFWRRVGQQAVVQGVLRRGMTMALGGHPTVTLEVLHPPADGVPGADPESNDVSLVFKLTMGTVSILLTGDIEEAGLPTLLRIGDALQSTVLKVPHHGSRLGDVGRQLFGAVQPRVAVLSVGRAHHLPTPQTLQALRDVGAMLYTTRDDGAIRLRTDGRRLTLRTFRSARRAEFGFDETP